MKYEPLVEGYAARRAEAARWRDMEKKHAWLCLDPGITTGWAVLDDEGSIMATSVWGTGELKTSLDLLIRQAFTSAYTLDAVIEKMPNTGRMGLLGQKLEKVRREIMDIIETTYEIPVTMVLPGTWKPSRVARITKVPGRFMKTPLMTHQRDAIRMGRYVIDQMKVK